MWGKLRPKNRTAMKHTKAISAITSPYSTISAPDSSRISAPRAASIFSPFRSRKALNGVSNVVEERVDVVTEQLDRRDGDQRNQCDKQTVLDQGRPLFIGQEGAEERKHPNILHGYEGSKNTKVPGISKYRWSSTKVPAGPRPRRSR